MASLTLADIQSTTDLPVQSRRYIVRDTEGRFFSTAMGIFVGDTLAGHLNELDADQVSLAIIEEYKRLDSLKEGK